MHQIRILHEEEQSQHSPANPFTLERLRAQELEERSLLIDGQEPLVHACSLKFTLHLSFQLESLNFLPSLQCLDGVSFNESHVKQLWQALGQNLKLPPRGTLECQEVGLSFCGPQSIDFYPSFDLSWMVVCLVSLPPWYLTLTVATLDLAQSIHS